MPYSRVYINTDDPIEEENLMEFRLLYQGELPPSANKPRPRQKHAIRRAFHPQLRELWRTRPNLRRLAFDLCVKYDAQPPTRSDPSRVPTAEERHEHFIGVVGKQFNRVGYDCVPLVLPEFALQCSVDILLLRPENYQLFSEWADLDGQVKTLIDALQLPDKLEEVGPAPPTPDEIPLFCLLKDDKLISEVKITADKLLMLPELPQFAVRERDEARASINILLEDKDCRSNFSLAEKAALQVAQKVLTRRATSPNDAFVVIHVKLNHREATTFGNYFG